MDPTAASALRTGQILIGALTFGMLSFTVIAAFLAGQMTTASQVPADALFIALGAIAITEVLAYLLLIRPAFTRQVRRDLETISDPIARASFLEQRFLVQTLIAGALAEGLGLFGAVIILITGRLEALAAPVLCTLVMMFVFPTAHRLDRFTRAASEPA